jgi:PAS domain S-box-containing protein
MATDQDKLGQIKQVLKSHPEGLSIRDLSASLGMNRNSVAKYLEILSTAGQVEMQVYGSAKVYFLSERVPLAAMLSFSGESILVLDEAFRIAQVNDRLLEFFGETREALVGHDPQSCPVEFLRNLPVLHLSRMLDQGEGDIAETSLEWGGREYFLRIKAVPLVFEEGGHGLALFIEDITTERVFERELAMKEARYRAIVEDQDELIARFLPDGTTTYANPSFMRFFGITGGESVRDVLYSRVHPDDQAAIRLQVEALTSVSNLCSFENRVTTPGGDTRWLQWTVRAITAESGGPLEFQAVGRDITARHEEEKRLSDHVTGLKFLSGSLMNLMQAASEEEIELHLAWRLKELVPEALAILVYAWDPSRNGLVLRRVFGDSVRDYLARKTGKDPVGTFFVPAGELVETVKERRQAFMNGGFAGDFFRDHPGWTRQMKESVDRDLGISTSQAVGLAVGQEFLGIAVLCLSSVPLLQNIPLLMIFTDQVSIALKRVLMEDAVRQNEERFRKISAFSPLPIAFISPEGRYLYMNPRFTEIFGYDLSDIPTGRDWFRSAFPDEEYRKMVMDAWKSDLAASEPGEVRPRTFRVRCRDGSDKEILFRPVTMSDGTQFIVYEDITERSNAERSRNLLAFIVQSSNDAIIGKDTRGTIISWNPAAEKMYGFSAEEAIGKPISLLTPPDLEGEVRVIMDRIRRGAPVTEHETSRLRKDGSLIDVSLSISPICDDQGRVVGASTIARDITHEKADRAAIESESRFRSKVENIDVGVYRSTGDPRGRFVWGNTSLLHVLGFASMEELKGVSVASLFVEPNGRAGFLQELKEEGFVKNRELHLKKPDGSTIWVLVTAVATTGQKGELTFVNGIVEDITRRKLLEQELGAAREEMGKPAGAAPQPGEQVCLQAFRGARDSMAVIDTGGRIIVANEAFMGICGMEEAELMAENYANLVAPEDRRAVMDSLHQATRSGSARLPYSLMTGRGRVPVEACIAPLRPSPEGDSPSLLVVVQRLQEEPSPSGKRSVYQ